MWCSAVRDTSVSCVASYVKNYFCSAWHYSKLHLSQMSYSSVQGFSREQNIQGPDLKAPLQFYSAPEEHGQFFFLLKACNTFGLCAKRQSANVCKGNLWVWI